jgi:hypothetical protein
MYMRPSRAPLTFELWPFHLEKSLVQGYNITTKLHWPKYDFAC